MSVDKDKICKDAVDTFGVNNQFDMVFEEFGELIQALNKIKRTFDINKLSEIKEGKVKFNNVKEALVYGGMCSEIADAKIMIRQLEYIFSNDHINLSEERKLIKLQDRIDKKNKN
ncbi:MAG: hypothetical protein IPJ01_11320 [Micavibrio sp.]|nr:hypothetical protein [Micavibrio sp.]